MGWRKGKNRLLIALVICDRRIVPLLTYFLLPFHLILLVCLLSMTVLVLMLWRPWK